ncbi:MAG: DUF1998 domain-containing protein [Polyangiaceae bacterium]|nr:DUF1998 domain-containing protein [Polyangiaceae bacterium]
MRRSQAVTTYGPGAMMDLLDQAVLVGGLDFWSYDRHRDIPEIQEPRLRAAIAEYFRAVELELSEEQPFLGPPESDEREPTRFAGIQVLEFPTWFVCQSPDCRALVRRDGLEAKGRRYIHNCSSTKKASETVPVRFVAACRRGHLDDFPWISFVHLARPEGRCAAPSLSLREGATGDFSEVEVDCACGASNKLSAALAGVPLACAGQRPWLGPQGREDCAEQLRLLVRTASNSYFSQTVSALSVPEPGRELEEKVRSVWDVLKSATPELLTAFRQIPKVQLAVQGFTDADVMKTVQAITKGTPVARLPLRTAEFLQFTQQPLEAPGDLAPADVNFYARVCKPKSGMPEGVKRLVLASKLREVAAQIGFTRLEASTPDLQGEFDLGVQSARLGLTTSWLPATEIRGEGAFIELDEAAVRVWEQRKEVKARGKALMAGYDAWSKTVTNPPPFPGVRFYLLHSLSHLLISAISLECGYSASAIRERIYCGPSPRDPQTPMAAILLSTGTSGTEGTLGGLVEEGRRLRAHLARAYDLGKLCSNDPVCAGHSPHNDPAERYLEGAACHGCLFIAECSCERFNRYLDRTLVVPSVGQPRELAFFGRRP